jgi:hypothetical protein
LFKRTTAVVATIAIFGAICTGLAGASATGTADATVRGSVVLLQSQPYFPLMLIDQCTTEAVANAHRLGINMILNEHCDALSAERQLAMIQQRSMAVLPIQNPTVRGNGLVGWTFPDEPENNGWTPATLRGTHSYLRGSSDGLLSFMTLGGGFMPAPYRDARVPRSTYSDFARMADVAGFDLYPRNHCQSDLTAVYDAQRAFIKLAGSMPTFQWIETGPIKSAYCGGFSMTRAELNAEVWLAIVGGARGIGFFTHTWSPDHNAFNVSPPLQQTMRKVSDLIGATRPGLLGETLPSSVDSGAIKVLARAAGNGRTYVFAVNTLRTPVKAQAHVPGLHHGSLLVFGERRAVSVNESRFPDTFGPLAVHIYVQGTAAK